VACTLSNTLEQRYVGGDGVYGGSVVEEVVV